MFAHSIKFLKDEAMKVICQRTGDEYYNVSDIQWVLTVPAIWTPAAKQFMREAGYEVSFMKSNNIGLFLTWEVIICQVKFVYSLKHQRAG